MAGILATSNWKRTCGWGCGPPFFFFFVVPGPVRIRSAHLLGAGSVIASDTVPWRLLGESTACAPKYWILKRRIYAGYREIPRAAERTLSMRWESQERRPASIVVDRIKVATFMGTDGRHVLRQAIE